MTGRNNTVGQSADDEHQRFARYLRDFAQVSPRNEADLIAMVLHDPDSTMAQSAVVRHLDHRAAQLLTSPGFRSWADTMVTVIGQREFLACRLREWELLRSIAMEQPWAAENVTAASDWLQRKAALTLTSRAVLTLLADQGRTRRVRSAARRLLAQQRQ